jgi:hypothetical protein
MGFSSHTRSQTNRDNLYAKSIKRRGSYFRLKAAFLEATEKEGLNFKEAWPHQIKAIKEKLRAQKIVEKKQFYKAMIASVISGLVLFFGISWMIRFVFF